MGPVTEGAGRPGAPPAGAVPPAASPAPAAGGGAPPEEPGAGRGDPGRGAFVIAQLYYYVAAVVGLGLLIGGAISALIGVRALILPREFEGTRDAVRDVLHGLAIALPGAPTFWWHLRQGRRREGRPHPPAFWGRSLYYHLVALVALGFGLGGLVSILSAGADAALPACSPAPAPLEPLAPRAVPEPPAPTAVPAIVGEQPPEPAGSPREVECYPEPREAAGRALDGLIVILVAAPVFLWHLKEGRRATTA